MLVLWHGTGTHSSCSEVNVQYMYVDGKYTSYLYRL